MASTNKTPNLGLNQWLLTDPFQVEDFNADNAKLDAVIGALVRSRAKIAYGSYVGTGTSGESNPTSLTFDFEPKLLLLIDSSGNDLPSILLKGGSKLFHFISDPNNAALWNYSFDGNSVSWYHTGTSWQHINGYFSQTPAGYHQSNQENQVYYYLAIG